MIYVLDAGPMLAFLNAEPGVDVVEELLTEPGSVCYVHAYNLCEVYYLYYRRGGPALGESAVRDLQSLGILLRDDLDPRRSRSALLERRRVDERPPRPVTAGRLLPGSGKAPRSYPGDNGPRGV